MDVPRHVPLQVLFLDGCGSQPSAYYNFKKPVLQPQRSDPLSKAILPDV